MIGNGFIDIWYGDILVEMSDSARMTACLSADERRFAQTIRNRLFKERYINTRYQIKMSLASYLDIDAREVAMVRTEHGKPYLPCRSLYFNVSHSGDKLALAVTDLGEIGVDIEQFKERHALVALAERCFAMEELVYWRPLSDEAQLTAFYRLWTSKEAYVKAIGRGIALGVEQCVVNPLQPERFLRVPENCGKPDDWRIFKLATDQGYCGAVVIESGEQTVSLTRKSFNSLLTAT